MGSKVHRRGFLAMLAGVVACLTGLPRPQRPGPVPVSAGPPPVWYECANLPVTSAYQTCPVGTPVGTTTISTYDAAGRLIAEQFIWPDAGGSNVVVAGAPGAG